MASTFRIFKFLILPTGYSVILTFAERDLRAKVGIHPGVRYPPWIPVYTGITRTFAKVGCTACGFVLNISQAYREVAEDIALGTTNTRRHGDAV